MQIYCYYKSMRCAAVLYDYYEDVSAQRDTFGESAQNSQVPRNDP